MVKMIQIIRGQEYEVEVGRNYLIGENIKGEKDGYKLAHATDGYISTIYFVSKNFFHSKEPKKIGFLLYDFNTDIVTYKKFIKTEEHEFHTTKSIGLNWDIVSNLCPKDYILVVENTGSKRFVHSISVSKALKFQEFKYFKHMGYEKQIFIPKCEFKTKEIEVSKKRGSRNGKSNKQRKTGS